MPTHSARQDDQQQQQLGTIEDYFLWSDMTPSQRRKIQHYQTLKYPKASKEGQVFTLLKQDPESINTFKRRYHDSKQEEYKKHNRSSSQGNLANNVKRMSQQNQQTRQQAEPPLNMKNEIASLIPSSTLSSAALAHQTNQALQQ